MLVVEDRADTAQLLASVLRTAGFEAATVRGARSVPEVLLEEGVAVVVVSFSGHGIAATTELVGELRSRPEGPLMHAGIVALVDDEIDVLFGLGDAADAVLIRPVPADRLIDVITDVAATPPAARQLRRRPLPLVDQVVG